MPTPTNRILLHARHLVLAVTASICVPCAASPMQDELEQVRSYQRMHPARALARLEALQELALLAPPEERGEYMNQQAYALLHTGRRDEARAVAGRLTQLADTAASPTMRIKAMLLKANLLVADNELDKAHDLFWQARGLAIDAADTRLRLQADISAGQAYGEAGKFDAALKVLLAAVDLARSAHQYTDLISGLQVLADLYEETGDYLRGLAAVDEAVALATRIDDQGLLATVRLSEFNLASSAGDDKRAIGALRMALSWATKNGVDAVAALAHANLADTYLATKRPALAVTHAQAALRMASGMKDERIGSHAHLVMGQALLILGQLDAGKQHMEAALAYLTRSGDRPQLVSDLNQYSEALALAGDHQAALAVLRRVRALADQLNGEQSSRAVAEVQEKYEAGKRQQQLDDLRHAAAMREAGMRRQRQQQAAVAVAAVLALVAAAVMGTLLVRLRRVHAQLRQLSIRDPLTSLFNRRHFQEVMGARPAPGMDPRQRTRGEVDMLIVLDIDHFKRVNDTHGHAAGDAVLRAVAQNLRQILRKTDLIVRWGGEEFLAFIEGIERAEVEPTARRILAGIAASVAHYQGTAIPVTVSVGFAQLPLAADNGPTLERAIALADQALYLAKHGGRNRAYGLRSIAAHDPATLDHIEHHMEDAARAGLVDLVSVTA